MFNRKYFAILGTLLTALWMGFAQAQPDFPAVGTQVSFEGGGSRFFYLLPGCRLTIRSTEQGLVFIPDSEAAFKFLGAWPTQPGTLQFNTKAAQLYVTFTNTSAGTLVPVNYRLNYKDLKFDMSNACEGLTPVN